MNRELLRMALSPYIPANCSGHNQPSAGLCLQLENFPSVLPTSVISAKNEWILFIICPKMCYVGAGFFSIGVCYRDLFSKTLLVEALPPWSSLWSSFLLCDIGCGVFFHCWLSQQSVVVNWWLPQFLSSEFAPKYHPFGLLLVDFSSNVSSPDHGLGGKDLWKPDLSHWKLLI